MTRSRLALIAWLAGSLQVSAASAQAVLNGDFEARDPERPALPAGWSVGGDGYEFALDSVVARGANLSLRIESVGAGAFAYAAQDLDARSYRGTRIVLSGHIRTSGIDRGYAGLWLRLDGAEGRMIYLDNMAGAGAVGTSDWTEFTVSANVGNEVERIVVGPIMPGSGVAWFDDLSVEQISLESLEEPVDSAAAYLNRALDLIQARSINRATIDWQSLRAAAMQNARGAGNARDTYPAIRAALASLGDGHSFFIEPAAAPSNPTARSGSEAARAFGVRSELVEGRFGYLSVPGFSSGPPELLRQFAQTIQRHVALMDEAGACGWVVDLRGNGGGNMWPMLAGLGPVLGEGDAGYFVGPEGRGTAWGYHAGAAVLGSSVNVELQEPYRLRAPDPPVAVLTGPGTASSGEAIVVAFRGRPNSRSFGTGTRGLSTSNATLRLSDGAAIALTTAVFADRLGQTYGSVIVPDEVQQPADAGAALDIDPVVRSAISWLALQAPCVAENP